MLAQDVQMFLEYGLVGYNIDTSNFQLFILILIIVVVWLIEKSELQSKDFCQCICYEERRN